MVRFVPTSPASPVTDDIPERGARVHRRRMERRSAGLSCCHHASVLVRTTYYPEIRIADPAVAAPAPMALTDQELELSENATIGLYVSTALDKLNTDNGETISLNQRGATQAAYLSAISSAKKNVTEKVTAAEADGIREAFHPTCQLEIAATLLPVHQNTRFISTLLALRVLYTPLHRFFTLRVSLPNYGCGTAALRDSVALHKAVPKFISTRLPDTAAISQGADLLRRVGYAGSTHDGPFLAKETESAEGTVSATASGKAFASAVSNRWQILKILNKDVFRLEL